MKTKMTEMLGIQYPIMQGGMQNLGVPELAAAVSEAGGLGTINVATFPALDDLRKAIRAVKALTSKPFAVNISLVPALKPGKELYDQLGIILDEGVTVIETAGASPQELADFVNQHKDQLKWIHKAACIKHGKKAESMGADIITMAGYEVAGHPHTDGIGTMVLANKAAREIKVPVLAAGGIVDGRSMLAALSMGCEGVVLGTRFVACKECTISENHKQWILDHNENETVLCQKSIRNMVRVANNEAAKKCLALEAQGATLEELMTVIAGRFGREAYATGNVDGGLYPVGPVIGLIHDVPTCAQIIQGMVSEAEAQLALTNRIFAE